MKGSLGTGESRHDCIAYGFDQSTLAGKDFVGHHVDALEYQLASFVVTQNFVKSGAAANIGEQDSEFFYVLRHRCNQGNSKIFSGDMGALKGA